MNQQSTMRETLNRLNGVITGRRILNEGGVGQIADDLASLSDEEFQKEYGKSKADARKSFSGGEKKESVKEGTMPDHLDPNLNKAYNMGNKAYLAYKNNPEAAQAAQDKIEADYPQYAKMWLQGYRDGERFAQQKMSEAFIPPIPDAENWDASERQYRERKNQIQDLSREGYIGQVELEVDSVNQAKSFAKKINALAKSEGEQVHCRLKGLTMTVHSRTMKDNDLDSFVETAIEEPYSPDMGESVSEARDGDINFGHGHTADPYFAYDKSNPEKFMRFKTRNGAKAYAEKQGWQIASAGFFYDNIKGKTAAKEGYDAGGAYDKWDPKHPEFMKNYKKFQASNPGSTLKDFIAQLKKGVNEVSDDTLMSYQKKVSADFMKNNMDPTKRSPEKRNRSVSGVAKAHNRLEKRMGEGLDASEDAVRVRGGQRFLFPEDGKLGYTTDGGGNEFTILDQETGEVRDISLDKLPDNPLQSDLEHLLNQYDDEQFTSGASVPDWIKKSSSMWKESAEKKVDMTGKKCTSCKKGTYEETSQHDDMDGVLHCTKCRKEVKRHQTASPKKKGVSEASRGFRGVGGAREREDDERHDLDRSDWYIVKDGKLLKASIYPSQEAQAREEGFSPTREEARSKADKKVAKENFGGGMRDRPGSDDKQFDLAECRKFLKKRL